MLKRMMRRLVQEIATIRRVSGPAGTLMGASAGALLVGGLLAALG